jgi:Zn ribbon nucleic-acid-binding protein
MSHFLYNERCPKCSANGADKSGNNLAVYSDTHKYCFACGYHDRGDIVEKFKDRLNTEREKKNVNFFNHSDIIDKKALIYLKKYGLTDKEIYDNYFWDSAGYLVFNGGSYQNARNFTGVGAKYMTRGVIRNNEPIMQNTQNDSVIIVEDAISAIKVSRVLPSVPIHNSIIPLELILRLSKRFKKLFVWLDKDKSLSALKQAGNAKLLFDEVRTIWTDLDPKCYSETEIKKYLNVIDMEKQV